MIMILYAGDRKKNKIQKKKRRWEERERGGRNVNESRRRSKN